jgi:hypothetical protein
VTPSGIEPATGEKEVERKIKIRIKIKKGEEGE